jgi:hypothetical protein
MVIAEDSAQPLRTVQIDRIRDSRSHPSHSREQDLVYLVVAAFGARPTCQPGISGAIRMERLPHVIPAVPVSGRGADDDVTTIYKGRDGTLLQNWGHLAQEGSL